MIITIKVRTFEVHNEYQKHRISTIVIQHQLNDLADQVRLFLKVQQELYGKPDFSIDLNTDSDLMDKLSQINTLEELRIVCEAADELKTDLPGTQLVFGKGLETADLMIIGEAPGAEEDRLGEPFVGRSGQLLTKILEAIQFTREMVYIANIVKHRPPNNETPTAAQRAAGLPYLLRQIELVDPKLILCLGKSSMDALLNTRENLADLRGKCIPFMGDRELMVTYHPAALLRNANLKRDTWEDVKLLRQRYDERGCKP